jgi:glycosyltransferase involved in cell wall biosynthesis
LDRELQEKSPESLAHPVICLLKDKEALSKLSCNALSFSRQFSWDNTANEFDRIITSMVLSYSYHSILMHFQKE